MHCNPTLAKLAVILALGASRVGAQEQGRVALDLGYPPAFAVLWRVADHVALRPELSFLFIGGEQSPTVWQAVPGVSALVSIHASGALTPYAGARLAGFYIKGGTGPEEWLASALAGARFALARHFGVSAETGLAYTRSRFRVDVTGHTVPFANWSVTPTGRVSALLYF